MHVRDGGGALLAYDEERLAGVGVLDGRSGELVVHPDLRRRGHGRALATALLDRAGSLRLWAHGELPGAVALAESLGFQRFRALWQMRRALSGPLPDVALPDGVRLHTFEPGRDEDAWVRANARAFTDHPEQGRWTRADLERREREPWFAPEGFFLAERAEGASRDERAGHGGRDEREGRGGELLGFHWTKVHGDGLGEVYVVGVDPAAQGLGLGKVLTVVGLRHLKELGLATVMLYVDESNKAAIGLYRGLGFEHWSTDAMYARTAPEAP